MANHDGLVKIEREGDDKKLYLKHQGQHQDTFILDEDESWKINVKTGDKVKKGDILASFSHPKGKSKKIKAKHDGEVKVEKYNLKVIYQKNDQEEYNVTGYDVWVKDGEQVKAGQQLTDGSLDLRELYRLKGKEATGKYILKEISYIYSSQGQKLNSKHVELIIRQMFSRVLIKSGGGTGLLPGDIIPQAYLQEINQEAKRKGLDPAKGEEQLLGITRVSLSTDSWLAAASFQETSRVLVKAAISGRPDYLRGLKENVIVGRLIPVGTGLKRKNIKT